MGRVLEKSRHACVSLSREKVGLGTKERTLRRAWTRGPVDFEVVGVRICRIDGGMVDNIMMASAGQGGAGLRGDQYYPPPPPPPRFPPPRPPPAIPPPSPRPSFHVRHHHRRLHPTPATFSPFYRRSSFASSSFSPTSPVLRIELLARRDGSPRSISQTCRSLV